MKSNKGWFVDLAGRVGGRRTAGRFKTWRRLSRRSMAAVCVLVLGLGGLLMVCPWGCTPQPEQQALPLVGRTIRVRLLGAVDQATLTASEGPVYWTASDSTQRRLNLPANTPMSIILTPDGWRVGATTIGRGDLTFEPASIGSLAINGVAYRGSYRFSPLGPGRFDVINDVDLDEYLQSVISKELFPAWHPEAYRAQAVAARTYALYEKHFPREQRRGWDVLPDQRSQVYGGIPAETPKSVEAVRATRGLVMASGPAGQEKIFKTYFSSCCGGITQSNNDAFGDAPVEPLLSHVSGQWCSISPRYNWGPVVISKEELGRRLRAWGLAKGYSIQGLGTVRTVDIDNRNANHRPTHYSVIDSHGARYVIRAEDFRAAFNSSANDGVILYSSFVDSVISDTDRIRFIGGHGYGHGVGMCQWCTEARARSGLGYEDILLAAYPGAKLLRAY